MKPIKNISASVRQRLLNRSKEEKRPFNELLQYYAMERFLYRLSQSAHADRFILKGALMLRVWRSPEHRPTMDIDMLGKTDNEEESVVAQVKDIMGTDVEPDGLLFDFDSVHSERITEDADYEGVRIKFRGLLDSARVNMQIDIGFGDVVYPEPEESDLPTMLDFPAPKLLCYSRESAIAEKFEAMVTLGVLNSRMKDFYDIWLLSRQFGFERAKLAEAIRLTFKRRGTTLPIVIDAFEEDFVAAKQIQWAAFCRRLKQDHLSTSFQVIVSDVASFLAPIASSISQESSTFSTWGPAGPWK